MREPQHVVALRRAIQIVGGQAELAERISKHPGAPKITQQGVSKWLSKRSRISAEYWPAIEAATSREVTREQLRPDVFGSDQAA